jgi:dipeptidyl aminopeptidase/acylaminoacyl peptidase
MKNFLIPVFTGIILASCQTSVQQTDAQTEAPLIGKSQLTLSSDIMTPEWLWSLGRLSDVQVSPDGEKILYGVTYYSIEQDRSNRELFLMNSDGSGKVQLTNTPEGEFNAVWHPDGKQIVYLSSASGDVQAWVMQADGSGKRKISDIEGGITGLAFSPTGDRVLYTGEVQVEPTVHDLYPDLDKTDGKVITDLMYRHWDTWEDGAYSHIFVADFQDGTFSEGTDIMPGEPYDSPLKPFGGMEEIAWVPDGTAIAYTCKKLTGIDYTFSTNSDIYLYDLGSGETRNLTEGMPGYDKAPFFSPDGSRMYWLSMERATFESDKDRLFELDMATGNKRYLTEDWDYSPAGLAWEDDGQTLLFTGGVESTFQLFRMNVATANPEAITEGDHDYHSVAVAGDRLIATRVDMAHPQEIFSVDPITGEAEELSFENKALMDQVTLPVIKKRWVTTVDNKQMLVWAIYPPHFDPDEQYPAVMFMTGGPQGPLSQFWSYRWNMSLMASYGYVVIAPARRGVTTHGQEWTDQVSKDNSGLAMQDLLSAIDDISREPYVDEERLGAVGASFGGFSAFWMAGNHEKRFKVFIAHDGVFNSEMEYYTTDEMFFDQWEKGGAPWETDNPVAMKSFAGSPHNFVKNWDTPIMVIHGGQDFRIPDTQGLAAFNAAQMLGIPSKLLYFPSENHWVLHPQNGILWQREFKGWLDQWLKD